MLDQRFAYNRFLAGTEADRKRLADELGQELTRRLQAASDPAQAGHACIEDLPAWKPADHLRHLADGPHHSAYPPDLSCSRRSTCG